MGVPTSRSKWPKPGRSNARWAPAAPNGTWSRRARFSLLVLLALAGCATPKSAPTPAPQSAAVALSPVAFADLPGWRTDDLAAALPALRASCTKLTVNGTGKPVPTQGADWQPFCGRLAEVQTTAQLRALAEATLTPWRANVGDAGLFTGYYEPELPASRTRGGDYQTPIYRRPASLVTVDLGLFRDSLKGQTITGRVDRAKLVPFYDRAAVASDALPDSDAILFARDPVDVFFLEIQGSGRARLPDGTIVRLGYDAQNGLPYTAIGKQLKESGAIVPLVSMPKIRAWLAAHSDQAQQVMNANRSVVFFRETTGDNPKGAAGVALTPGRSLAVDKTIWSYHLPLFLATTDGAGAQLDRLIVAQDTGGAITGTVRGDLFWGAGAAAAAQAGTMQQPGALFTLLPNSVQP